MSQCHAALLLEMPSHACTHLTPAVDILSLRAFVWLFFHLSRSITICPQICIWGTCVCLKPCYHITCCKGYHWISAQPTHTEQQTPSAHPPPPTHTHPVSPCAGIPCSYVGTNGVKAHCRLCSAGGICRWSRHCICCKCCHKTGTASFAVPGSCHTHGNYTDSRIKR